MEESRTDHVRPLTVLTGIILGSSAATTFGLAATLVVFLVLGDEHPQFRSERPLLAVYLAIFLGLTALAGASWWWAQAALWVTLCLLATVYWQTRG